jgi:hypothetical protein
MGRAKMARWGQGAVNSGGKRQRNVQESAEKRKVKSSNRPDFGGVVLALQAAALGKDVLLLCNNTAVLCAIKKLVGQELLSA